jgi:putative transport protein
LEAIREIIENSEPLLLFLAIGIGFLIGEIKIRGFKLGVAGVLFAGLIFGGWCPEGSKPFSIAHQIMQIGLILFVYTVGLTSGSGFFASLKKRGFKFNVALLFSLVIGAAATLIIGLAIDLQTGQIAGVFCGGLTNTPAMAAVTEFMGNSGIGDVRDPAIGYSMTYPFGILGGLLAFQIFAWVYRKPAREEKSKADLAAKEKSDLISASFKITNKEIFDRAIGELEVRQKVGVIISRLRHDGKTGVPTKYSVLHANDIVNVVGLKTNIDRALEYFGERSDDKLEQLGGAITMRRILDRHFNAQITRLRRADIDIIPDETTVIKVGDRVRVVMPTDKAAEVAEFFGDSERSISELDYVALTLGMSLGVLLGMIPIPIPGGSYMSLGFAGGPLVAGLVLGHLGRTGPLVWSIPTESNQALQHIGLLFFLAAVGVQAGGKFFLALSGDGYQMFALGILTTMLTSGVTLIAIRHFGKATIVETIGAASGMQTQPATLARAYEMSRSDDTYVAYATVYPMAMVGKILIAQLMVILGHMLA